MVLRRTGRLVHRIDMAELRAEWLRPNNSFKTGSIVVAALLSYVEGACRIRLHLGHVAALLKLIW